MSPNPDAAAAEAAAAFVERRKHLGVSQEQVRDKTGLSVSSLIDFEKARSWPRARTQALLEDVVGWAPGTLERLKAGSAVAAESPEQPDPAAVLVLDGLRHVERLAVQAVRIAADPVAAANRLADVRDLIETLSK